MDKPVEQALVVGLFTLSKLLRAAPNLAEAGPGGTSLVIEAWRVVLDGELPTLTAAEVQAGFQAHAGASPFFPAPAELIAQVRQIRSQRALRTAEDGGEERRRALPAHDSDEAAHDRQEALERIRGILADLAAKMGSRSRVLPLRSLAEMEAEVARLRVLEGKPLRVIDGGKP